jgi:hypothetical protein
MSTTVIAQPYHVPVLVERGRSATLPTSVSTPTAERRLWKITAHTGAERKAESVLFTLFGMLGVGSVLYAFSTLFQVLDGESLTRVVELLTRY